MAVDIIMKIEKFIGESKIADGYIDIIGGSGLNLSQYGSFHHGGGGSAGKVDVSNLSFIKPVDLATTDLMRACCQGTHLEKAVIFAYKAGGEPLPFFSMLLQDVIVTNVATPDLSSEDAIHSFALHFARFGVFYASQSAKGSKDKQPYFSWDIAGNKSEVFEPPTPPKRK